MATPDRTPAAWVPIVRPRSLGNELLGTAEETILVPIVHALKRARTPFRGLLYAGLMVTPQGLRVLEFNVRFGDPETQPLLMRLRTDLLDLLEAVVDDRLLEFAGDGLDWDPRRPSASCSPAAAIPAHFRRARSSQASMRRRQSRMSRSFTRALAAMATASSPMAAGC